MDVEQQVANMQRIFGYTFQDRQLAVECLYQDGLPIFVYGAFRKPEKNERLAVVGDHVLDLILSSKWYYARDAQGISCPRVHWNALIRNDLVTNSSLSVRGRKLGLDVCVIKDVGTRIVSTNMMATTFEAVIGAIFLDTGANNLDTVRVIMGNLGFFEHPMLMVTYHILQCIYCEDIQMITKVQYLDTS